MKRTAITSALTILFLTVMAMNSYAQRHKPPPPPPKKHHPAHQPVKVEARHSKKIINRTFPVLKHARAAVKQGQNYTGDLSKAVAHQKRAVKMHKKGKFHKAIYHSRRARVLAVQAIRANKGEVKAEFDFDDEENQFGTDQPSDEELDNDVKVDTSDEELINAEDWNDLDIK